MANRLYQWDTTAPPGLLQAFTRQALIFLLLVTLAALVWYTAKVLLLAFAAVLLAVFLDYLTGKLAGATHLGRGWAFAIVTVGAGILLSLAGWVALPHIADQISQLIRSLPQSLERLQSYLNGRGWGRMVLSYLPNVLASSGLAGRISHALHLGFYALAGLVEIAVLGVYLGASPSTYDRGLLKLFPGRHRPAARAVFGEVAYTLRWWILGQLIPMAVLGIATTIGLYLLHVHLAFTLGLFTGLMIFIPYIGSLIALIVTALVSLIQGTALVLYVVLMFLAIHIAEGYFLTPLVQKRAVYLPPALTIFGQVLMGILLGFLGLALATPFTAASLVLVKMLYLHEEPQHHG